MLTFAHMEHQGTDTLHAASNLFVCGLGPVMQSLHDLVNEVARTDIPVLLVGESGVGKDATARQIHRSSSRNELRFQKINCASFPAESLFQQVRGSVDRDSSAGSYGTLYLDNLHELDSDAQRILLSRLTDQEDSDSNFTPGVRLISSASSSLESEVQTGSFRSELYFRLNGVCLRIPPLRERAEDIPVLVEHFLHRHAAVLRKSAPSLSGRAIESLSAYPWPGNIRELENVLRKVVLFGDAQLALKDLHSVNSIQSQFVPTVPGSSLKVAARAASKKAERELILQALERTHWNRKRAARDLQISYKSLLYKIKQIGVSDRKQEG